MVLSQSLLFRIELNAMFYRESTRLYQVIVLKFELEVNLYFELEFELVFDLYFLF